MGTNFYVRNRNGIKEQLIHIGKRSNDEFLWAITEDDLIKIFKETPGLVIINEAGSMNGLISFMSFVKDLKQNTEYVGIDFC